MLPTKKLLLKQVSSSVPQRHREISGRLHCTFSKMSYDLWAWQLPSVKFPHTPCGVPKLANLMDEIFCPSAHERCAFGLRGLSALPQDLICHFLSVGCHSEMKAQALPVVLLTNEIPVGSPPHSSNTTKRFAVGYSQELGTWYLKYIINHQFKVQTSSYCHQNS